MINIGFSATLPNDIVRIGDNAAQKVDFSFISWKKPHILHILKGWVRIKKY